MAAVPQEIHTDRIVIPSDDDFEEGQEFLPSTELADLGEQLIERYEEIAFLSRFSLAYYWRKEGGTAGGRDVLGKCTVLSGYARYISECDFLVTLSADHCRNYGMTTRQIEAALFHQLCHATEDSKTGKPKLRQHDFEGFTSELDRYGLWTSELKEAADAMKQATLPIGVIPFGGRV